MFHGHSTSALAMAPLGPIYRVLLPGIIFAALALHANASKAWVVVPPDPAVAAPTLLYDDGREGSEASLQYVHLGRFCRWHKQHRLCKQPASLRRFCKEHRRHRVCRDEEEERFCRQHPRNRRCNDHDDDDRFCRKHPKHSLCRDDNDDDRFCRRHPNHRRCDDKPPSPH
jgi:hypothetical protein